ncbi:MAG: arsenite methyltransferase [Candidatus Freyarchaeota archaeon]|nr:arsenite methyltransferase [Candidatus Jordarchaeia archaeon]
MVDEDVKKIVREKYGMIAKTGGSCCGDFQPCFGSDVWEAMRKIGYSEEELRGISMDAILGLGCGNPVVFALLREGETVLDLGCGAGIDCFVAAKRVGASGRVIGVDMAPEMLEKARENARRGGFGNVEFRLGEIESLPVEDCSVDVIISNCVINLSPYKERVFREAFRVLKPGGRLVISDTVLLKELPENVKRRVDAYIGCIAGALEKQEYLETIKKAGFQDVRVIMEALFPVENVIRDLDLIREARESVASITVWAVKPRQSVQQEAA